MCGDLMKRIYRQAPLEEASCEFHFQSEQWDIGIMGQLFARVENEFPRKAQVLHFAIENHSENGVMQPQLVENARLQFSSDHSNCSWTVGENFLSINQRLPYSGWINLRPLIEDGYENYRAVAHPDTLQRIVLRYVNRLPFPDDTINLNQWFQFRPEVGDELPQPAGAFFMGVDLPRPDNAVLRIELSSIAPDPDAAEQAALRLAISCASREAVALDGVSDWLDAAHDHIWTAFEACLTPQMREHLKPEEVEE